MAPLPAAPSGRVTATPLGSPGAAGGPRAAPQQPAIEMAGRWVLASPGSGFCGMNFGSAPGAIEGTIAPEGGCPGKFFTSRKWVFEQNALVIRNHAGEPLAQLSAAEPGRLEGRATSGEQISLTR